MTQRPIVGIVGAGQLARMTQQAAIPLGVDLCVLAESPEDSAAQVIPGVFLGDYRSLDDLRRFAKNADVITFDHELPDPEHLAALAHEGRLLRPSPLSKRFAQDKSHQRRMLALRGFAVPPFADVTEVGQVEAFADANGWPVVLKAPRGGYDGRGVHVVADAAQAHEALALSDGPLLVEAKVPLARELAVLVARRPAGRAVAWPVTETVQVDGILRELVVPAPIGPARRDEALRLGARIAEAIELAGVMAVELFDTGDRLLINELACRPHNSGHWTIDASATSQFSNHLRAVLDWPLGDTTPLAAAIVTVNVLGRADGSDPADGLTAALSDPAVAVHLYGKEARPGRKLGHVTALGDDADEVRERARAAAAALGEPLDEEMP
ncbi:MAG: 5-(carboxyamino)imidazole ribonucleotide synthase [Nitriliruptorales bacterium]|nr:5-(carboxyamino)imidazole ribonucleotide synthase [Nitriliruptorales bacterium]